MMSKATAILILAAISYSAAGMSQNLNTEEGNTRNPVREITESSEGNVVIEIPENILENLLASPQAKKSSGGERGNARPGIRKSQGYRIQVFSDGRNQHSLEARAKARGNAIVAKFPKYRGQVYTFSSSPNWYTRVGNFSSSSEASNALNELKRAFPSFAGEMRIVRSQIVIIK